MPYLKTILVNANDKANRMLRAKSMECISLVGMAVGKEKFRDDAKQVGLFTHTQLFLFLGTWKCFLGWIPLSFMEYLYIRPWDRGECAKGLLLVSIITHFVTTVLKYPPIFGSGSYILACLSIFMFFPGYGCTYVIASISDGVRWSNNKLHATSILR